MAREALGRQNGPNLQFEKRLARIVRASRPNRDANRKDRKQEESSHGVDPVG